MLYRDSIGNPRKFARTARAVGRTVPLLTVNVEQVRRGPAPGRDARDGSVPHLTRQALFEQAGVIATANFGELLDAAALVASQPVPGGRGVGVVSNTRGGGMLAADACGDVGLQVASLADDTQRALRGPASRRGRGDRAGRYHGGGQVRSLPPAPGACRRRPGRGRGSWR